MVSKTQVDPITEKSFGLWYERVAVQGYRRAYYVMDGNKKRPATHRKLALVYQQQAGEGWQWTRGTSRRSTKTYQTRRDAAIAAFSDSLGDELREFLASSDEAHQRHISEKG